MLAVFSIVYSSNENFLFCFDDVLQQVFYPFNAFEKLYFCVLTGKFCECFQLGYYIFVSV